jgi:APA family basic amino acid/polyamine antiporter
VARKLRGFERVLDAPLLFAVAYDEIASSLYFALGIVVAQALGLTPIVLLASGALFLVVSLSYAEGTAAIPETGGAATLVRRTFNDLFGFITGWALLLDYLIVIALSTLFLPHYLSWALDLPDLRRSPWDAVVACGVIAALALTRLVRHSRLHAGALLLAGLDLTIQALLVVLGFVFLFSTHALTSGFHLATGQSWHDLAFALPLAMLAYTGLETVANLAEETREPGTTLPRSLFSAIGLVVVVTVLIATVGVVAYPAVAGSSALGAEWQRAPLVGIAEALHGHVSGGLVDALRILVGLSGGLILFAAATTSMSGCTRLLHSMGGHEQLPRAFGRLDRRSLVAPAAIVSTGAVAIATVIAADSLANDEVTFLASAYSFGVLLAFTAAQAAVIRLRVLEPDLERPFRARPDVRWRGMLLPLPALIGAPLAFAVWILAMITHPGARYAGPAWLVGGIVVYLVVRRRERHGLLEDVEPIETLPPGAEFTRVLVPMKLGDIGEEMVATAVALAKERNATVEAIYVVRVPREFPLEGPLPEKVAERAKLSLDEARALGEDNAVVVETETIRARSIGHAIVEEAARRQADLIVLGSAPRWRRQSRFFSPTVDHVLRHAPCQVLVVAFPEGVFEEAGGAA